MTVMTQAFGGLPMNGGGNTPPGLTSTGGTPASQTTGSLGAGSTAYNPSSDAQGAGGVTFTGINNETINTPAAPGADVRSAFLPDVFKQPFLDGLSAAGTTASYAGQALPGAGNFQAGLYSAGLNPMEQEFMNSSAYLGGLGLEQAFNTINDQYAMDPYHQGKNKAYYDGANQFAGQMMQTGSQLGLDRMELATQNLGQVFNQPNQSAQYGQQSAAGLYNAFDQAMLGDTKSPYAMWSNAPIQGSTYVQPS